MTAGKGFIALAALIFAKWRPVPALVACLLFGFLDAVADPPAGRAAAADRRGAGAVDPGAALLLTVFLLAGFIGQPIAPRAGGVPYVKER